MADKKKITKFVCPKCNAQKKTFAESVKDKIACFRCNTIMVPKAEDLGKPKSKPAETRGPESQKSVQKPLDSKTTNQPKAKPDHKVNEAKDSGASNTKLVPNADAESDSQGNPVDHSPAQVDYSTIQTTTQDINPDGYGVVVTDTGVTLGSVEVSTFRFSETTSESSEPTSASNDSSSSDPNTEESHPKAVEPPVASEAPVPFEDFDRSSDEQNARPIKSTNTNLETPDTEDGEAGDVPAPPHTVSEAKPKPDASNQIRGKRQTNQSQGRVNEPTYKSSRQKSKKSRKTKMDSDGQKSAGFVSGNQSEPPTFKANELQESKPAKESKPAQKNDQKSIKLSDGVAEIPAPSNLLPLTFAGENKWFLEMMAFTKSSELMLRYLVVALLTGLGLSFVVGQFGLIGPIGYVVALPGLFVLAVAGADITKQTILGFRLIEQWTSWNIRQILDQSLLVILSFSFSVIPGAVLSIPFILSTSSYILTAILGSLSLLILFPMLMLSMIENGSNAQPFSAAIFGSIKSRTKNWWNFFGVSLLLAFVVLVFSFFISFGGMFLVCFCATLGISMVALVYFRILGLHYRSLFPKRAETKK